MPTRPDGGLLHLQFKKKGVNICFCASFSSVLEYKKFHVSRHNKIPCFPNPDRSTSLVSSTSFLPLVEKTLERVARHCLRILACITKGTHASSTESLSSPLGRNEKCRPLIVACSKTCEVSIQSTAQQMRKLSLR